MPEAAGVSVLRFSVNGRQVEVKSAHDTPLIYVLRNELGLTGAKIGCAREQCGACAVIVDDKKILSCNAPVGQFAGSRIQTPETTDDAVVDKVRKAFVESGAAQCGYCIPGMVMASAALLISTPQPDDQEIRSALKDHLCRCGTQTRVLKAVRGLASDGATR
jgi:aerobic-type carbon monoxide dehydrogenase small subunit (CoxS/CutS family)